MSKITYKPVEDGSQIRIDITYGTATIQTKVDKSSLSTNKDQVLNTLDVLARERYISEEKKDEEVTMFAPIKTELGKNRSIEKVIFIEPPVEPIEEEK